MGDAAMPREPATLQRRLGLAQLALIWEGLWPALWPALGVVGTFLALALFDLPAQLPSTLHWALLTIIAILLAAALVDAARRFRWPDHKAARRRIEIASGLAHRPLTALEDELASGAGDPAVTSLWRAHQARMADAVRRLRIGTPEAGLVRRDPYALRVALSLVLILGAIDAGGDWSERLVRALNPGALPFTATTPVSLDIWVTPPDYTGLPPLFLPAHTPRTPIDVPIGSTVLAQVHGGGGAPRLYIDGRGTDFSRIDDEDFKGGATITAGQRLTVAQRGRTLGTWPIRVIPDLPPTIEFARPPSHSLNMALRLDYKARDDYGVEAVKAIIRRADDPKGPMLTLNLPLPGDHLKNVQSTSYNDLTPNIWAGLPVSIQLEAVDARGQIGTSDTVQTVLPERVFHNPLAKAIIEQRKDLILHPNDKEPVAEILSDLSLETGFYNGDIVVFLALRTSSARLMLDRDGASLMPVENLLWQTALRVENGQTPQDQQNLRMAMQALQNALAHDAPNSEIDRLTRQVQEAMNKYFQALAQQMAGQNPSAMQPVDPSQMLSTQDLQHMLDQAHRLAQTGARDQARQLLSQLQQMLENMRLARPMPGQNGARQMMGQMQQLMQQQQQLLDRSFSQSQQDQLGESQNEAQQQDALRQMLDQLRQRLQQQNGQAPRALSRAERAMRGATEALRQNQPGQAVGPQSDALDALQEAARAMGNRMMGNNYGDGQSGEPLDDPSLRQAQRDPFGRLLDTEQGNGGFDNGGQLRMGKALDDNALEKARQILDELRHRAGQQARPEIERNYIDRLLKEF